MNSSKHGEKTIKINIKQRIMLIYMICILIPLLFGCAYLYQHSLKALTDQQKSFEYNSVSLQSDTISSNFNRVVKLSQKIAEDKVISLDTNSNQIKNEELLKVLQENEDIVSEIYIYARNGKFLRTDNSLVINQKELFNSVYKTVIGRDNEVEFITFYDRADKEHLCLVKGMKAEEDKKNTLILIVINPKVYKTYTSQSVSEVWAAIDKHTIRNSNNRDQMIDDSYLEEFTKENKSYLYTEEEGIKYIITAASDLILDTEHVLSVYSVIDSTRLIDAIKIEFRAKVIFFVLPFLFSMFIVGIFAINFSKRLNAFKNHMHKAAAGDFAVSSGLKGTDEINELYEDLNLMISSIEHLITTVYESQVQKEKLNSRQKEVEFKMLASQINPHFLYNTLETIRMKARSNGQKDIEELVKMLAKIMRRNIQAGDTLVTLKSEIDLVEYYLKIQQYRFGERIGFHINLFCDIEYLKIMPLIIQPVVENAFVHGLETKEGEGEIRIEVRRSSNRLQIYVIDDGIGMTKEKLNEIKLNLTDFSRLTRSNIGLSNVDQRIKLLYGEEYGLWIDSAENMGTTVIIDLPEDMSQ